MVRMRLILAAIVTSLGYFQYTILQHGFSGPVIVLDICAGILLLSAASILLFSFFRVDVMPDGRLCYNPDNPYWKLMGLVYPESFKSAVSLCRAYWATVGLLALVAGLLIFASAAIFIISMIFYAAYTDLNKFAIVLGFMALIVLCVFIIGGLIELLGWIEEKKPWFENVNSALRIIVLFAFVVALPIFLISLEYTISYGAAALIYLKWVGIGISVIAGTILLIWAAFRYLPALKNTWAGYVLQLAKKELCPQLAACPIDANLPMPRARENS